MDIEMSTEEARMIWLTMLGSDWVDEDILMNAPSNSPLDAAAIILDYEALLVYNYYRYKIKHNLYLILRPIEKYSSLSNSTV